MPQFDLRQLRVPSPPSTLATVIRAASDPSTAPGELARLVSADPGFAVRVLQIVNSPLYNRGSKVSSVAKAISLLGSRKLRNVALCAATQGCVRRRALGEFDLRRFWEDSLRRASAAQLLAEADPQHRVDPMEAFTAALVQDLGVLALVQTAPAAAEAWMTQADGDAERRRSMEHELFGASHDAIAEQLASAWGLPPELADPMRHHHAPARAPAATRFRVLLSHRAETLAGVLIRQDKREALAQLRKMLDQTADVARDADALLRDLGVRVAEAASALGHKVRRQPSMEDLLVLANQGLGSLNLGYDELVAKLERALSEKDALTQQLEARNRELERLSLTDPLTDLANRRAFSGRASYEVARLARHGGALAVVVADLDHFKRVNDTWGHDFGDEVLQHAAEVMRDALRDCDLVARIGGEEFALLFPQTTMEAALEVSRRVNKSLARCELTAPDGARFCPTVSMGQAHIEGPTRSTFDADEVVLRLLKQADAALYAAKRGGRNRVAHHQRPVEWNTRPPRVKKAA